MRCSFKACEDLIYLAIFIVVAVVVSISVFGDDDAYPLVSAASVVTTAELRGGADTIETAPAPAPSVAPYIVTTPVVAPAPVATVPMTSTGAAAAH